MAEYIEREAVRNELYDADRKALTRSGVIPVSNGSCPYKGE